MTILTVDVRHVLRVQFSLECYSSHVWQKNIKLMVNLLQNQCSLHCAIQYFHVHVHAYICGGGQVDKNPTEMS